jgi:two-component system OmpR family sensor kinase
MAESAWPGVPWFRSLRWRIQAWYAAILILSLCAFGTMLYWESSRAVWREMDGDLIGGVRALESVLRMPPPPPPFRNPGPQGPREEPPPRRPEFSDGEAGGAPNPRPMLPPPPQFPPHEGNDPRHPPRDRPPPHMMDWSLFDRVAPLRVVRPDRNNYRIVWSMDSTVIHQVTSGGALPTWEDVRANLRGMREGNVLIRQRGTLREAFLVGPRNSMVLGVGVDVRPELDRSNRLLGLLIGSGILVCGLGLAGGAWSLQRTLRPMRAMQETASTIRADNLSQRLNAQSIDSELADFAASINSMLDRVEAGFDQQRQFAADASHELRTPLAILLSSTELALSRDRTPEAYRAELEKCQRAAQRMKSLVEALLALSRMDASSQTLAMEPVVMDQLCREQLELHQELATQHQVSIASHLESCVLTGHAGVLERMVANLLLNSILYNREGGSIQTSLRSLGNSVVLEICDTGIGIPKEEIPNLFQRFYRVDKARSRRTGGSGLGLAICDLVVQLHHGKIDVESQVGVGSTFRITLPKRQPIE